MYCSNCCTVHLSGVVPTINGIGHTHSTAHSKWSIMHYHAHHISYTFIHYRSPPQRRSMARGTRYPMARRNVLRLRHTPTRTKTHSRAKCHSKCKIINTHAQENARHGQTTRDSFQSANKHSITKKPSILQIFVSITFHEANRPQCIPENKANTQYTPQARRNPLPAPHAPTT